MVSKLCSRSQGQPPGARSRAMIATRRSNFSPVVCGSAGIPWDEFPSLSKTAGTPAVRAEELAGRARYRRDSSFHGSVVSEQNPGLLTRQVDRGKHHRAAVPLKDQAWAFCRPGGLRGHGEKRGGVAVTNLNDENVRCFARFQEIVSGWKFLATSLKCKRNMHGDAFGLGVHGHREREQAAEQQH